jgi:fatty acid-binding protein DegV
MHRGAFDMERVRTNNGASDRLLELTAEVGPLETMALVHTHAPEKAEALAEKARDLVPPGGVALSAEVTPVIGAHIGPGAAGFVVVVGERVVESG